MKDSEIKNVVRELFARLEELTKKYEEDKEYIQKRIRIMRAECPHRDKKFCYGGQYERNYYLCRVCGADIDA